MTVLSSGEGGVPPPPPPPLSTPTSPIVNGSGPDKNLLLVDIRNGITLKPTKTKDKSTPAFIKKSNGVNSSPSSPPTQTNNDDITFAHDDKKDALQEELRNTLKRKIKKQDIELGSCAKKDEIEKAMAVNRTEIHLKVNTSAGPSPNMLRKDTGPVVKSPLLQRAPVNSDSATNGSGKGLAEPLEIAKSPVLQRPPAKPERTFTAQVVNNGPTNNEDAIDNKSVVNKSTQKEAPKLMAPVSSCVKPLSNSKLVEPGTLKKVPQQRELKIDVSSNGTDNGVKNAILSPEVKSGYASIRPSQIKTLTKKGSLVSHTDIVEQPKPVIKSPISLVESPKPYHYSPPTPKCSSPSSSGQSSPRTPTRTTILDTKFSRSLKSPLVPTAMDPMKKLLISHPKASFTLPRTNKQTTRQTILPSDGPAESKPVFRILTALEKAEQSTALPEPVKEKQPQQQQQQRPAVKADAPGTEPVLTSYVSFAKDLANAPNNYPDTVTKKSTTTVKQDLFYDSMNLRDIKFDIVENGQLRVTNK
ncbi:proteoglycan 4-like [Sabethes cyaneus]|uniref:proteoglycan 4-like n=1 Tax=Sabethes cyaneus TaxID=53552 RepID=UPI00237DF6CC|nr:proteoglycan 4-like [Sabethes cyaneus]